MADTLDLRAVMRCGECGHRFGADATFCPFDGTLLASQRWDPSADPLLGQVVDGRYQVLGVLGEGGMGTVYRVRHVALDRAFAMKVLRRDLASDPDLSARFMREANSTASVKHPNVVSITDFGLLTGEAGGVARGSPYFVMELLQGQTLARSIKAGGALPPALAVRIALKIASGLGAAHEARIVHRDLKPDNVFVLGDPAGDVDVRVVDFGASLVVGTNRVTKTGIVFGTPHYMSPEQASGQPVDHRADVYALGVILYEMLSGRVPFIADTYMGVLTQHMFVQPVPPSQVSDGAKAFGALEEVTLRALEKKPENRYASMAELAADLARASSFAEDGSLRIASSLAGVVSSVEPSKPLLPAAEALEVRPPTEAKNAGVTRTTARRRRNRARQWALYGGITLGVAGATLAVLRIVQSHHGVESGAANAATTPPPAQSATPVSTASSSNPASIPPAAALPTSAPIPASTVTLTAASAPTPSAGPVSRAPHGPSSPKKKPAAPLNGADFADPWAK